MRTGETFPASAIEEVPRFASIYLGIMGYCDFKSAILGKETLMNLRFSLDLCTNLLSVKVYLGVEIKFKNKAL